MMEYMSCLQGLKRKKNLCRQTMTDSFSTRIQRLAWILYFALVPTAGCNLLDAEAVKSYALTIYGEEGQPTQQATLQLYFKRDAPNTTSISGRWIGNLVEDRTYGSLKGGIDQDGMIWIDFRLYEFVTDYNILLNGKFIHTHRDDFEGEAFYTTIAGLPHGLPFQAIIQ